MRAPGYQMVDIISSQYTLLPEPVITNRHVNTHNKKAAEAASINHNFFIIVIIKMKNLPLADISRRRVLSML